RSMPYIYAIFTRGSRYVSAPPSTSHISWYGGDTYEVWDFIKCARVLGRGVPGGGSPKRPRPQAWNGWGPTIRWAHEKRNNIARLGLAFRKFGVYIGLTVGMNQPVNGE